MAKTPDNNLSRREFLRIAGLGGLGTVLSGCGIDQLFRSTPPTPTLNMPEIIFRATEVGKTAVAAEAKHAQAQQTMDAVPKATATNTGTPTPDLRRTIVAQETIIKQQSTSLEGSATKMAVTPAANPDRTPMARVNATAATRVATQTGVEQLATVAIPGGFNISPALAEKVNYASVEFTYQTTIKQENTIGKYTEAFLALKGGNLTIDKDEATRADLGGQVQLIMPGVTQGNFTEVGVQTLDIPERGWALLHSGTGRMSISMGKDRVIRYPGGTPDHVIGVFRGPYGIANQDTNENRRMKIGVTKENAGNILWQRLMAPATGNIGFITQAWFAKELANAHFASPNRGADGNSSVYIYYHDTNTRFTELYLNRQPRMGSLADQIAKSQDPATWQLLYWNA